MTMYLLGTYLLKHKRGRIMRVYKLTHSGMARCVYCTDLDVITGELDTANIGDKILIEIADMSQDEFDKLPEFEGW